jgi:hypothetical protein
VLFVHHKLTFSYSICHPADCGTKVRTTFRQIRICIVVSEADVLEVSIFIGYLKNYTVKGYKVKTSLRQSLLVWPTQLLRGWSPRPQCRPDSSGGISRNLRTWNSLCRSKAEALFFKYLLGVTQFRITEEDYLLFLSLFLCHNLGPSQMRGSTISCNCNWTSTGLKQFDQLNEEPLAGRELWLPVEADPFKRIAITTPRQAEVIPRMALRSEHPSKSSILASKIVLSYHLNEILSREGNPFPLGHGSRSFEAFWVR